MTQEDKKLLLADLCARLPYDVVARVSYKDEMGWKTEDRKVLGIYTNEQVYVDCVYTNLENVKPYLRPISTMTSNELDELIKRLNHISTGRIINKENFQIMPVLNVVWFTNMKEYECVSTGMMNIVIDFLNEYHFDYNDLISMDMAIEAPEDMYKID